MTLSVLRLLRQVSAPFFVFDFLIPPIVVRSPIESSKKLAAYTAVDHYVKPQHTVSSLI